MYSTCFDSAGGIGAVLADIEASSQASHADASRIAQEKEDAEDAKAIADMVALYVDALEQLRREYVLLSNRALQLV